VRYWQPREIFIISIFFHYLSNFVASVSKMAFWQILTLFIQLAKPRGRNGVKDIADSSEASKKLKNQKIKKNFWSKFEFLAQNLTNSNREK
jgi:hypothetical protein